MSELCWLSFSLMGASRPRFACLAALVVALGRFLGRSRAVLGRPWAVLGPSLAALGVPQVLSKQFFGTKDIVFHEPIFKPKANEDL